MVRGRKERSQVMECWWENGRWGSRDCGGLFVLEHVWRVVQAGCLRVNWKDYEKVDFQVSTPELYLDSSLGWGLEIWFLKKHSRYFLCTGRFENYLLQFFLRKLVVVWKGENIVLTPNFSVFDISQREMLIFDSYWMIIAGRGEVMFNPGWKDSNHFAAIPCGTWSLLSFHFKEKVHGQLTPALLSVCLKVTCYLYSQFIARISHMSLPNCKRVGSADSICLGGENWILVRMTQRCRKAGF